MQAVILAGGLGTRLLPRTQALPKSLIEVAGRPFIAWQLERLALSGFAEVVLCVGHLAAPIREFVANGSAFGLAVLYAEDGAEPLGTAGALRNALPLLADTFLVTYGDSYLPFDYSAPLRDLQSHPEALGTLAVYKNSGQWDASNTEVEGQRVLRYQKAANDPALSYIDYGAMALRKSVIAALPATTALGLERVQAELARAGTLRAYVASERFYEIGSESGLSALEQYLGAGSRR
ncbi:MAG TPA: sugar phosphate nucleotidyltransferase [Polyangiaceae bacterium]|nr:sugar phosphate nucleotidyltransferase [Polyangiaceae bacterium]